MEKDGFNPMSFSELLALGEKEPDLQKQFQIVALGTRWGFGDGKRVMYLTSSGEERRLLSCWYATDWKGFHRFGAVCK